jgi:PAS domain S-box-containing protein
LNEIVGTNSFDNIIDKSSKELVKKKILEKYEKPYEIYGVKKNGQKFPMEVDAREFKSNGTNLRIVSCRDITDRKKSQEIIVNQEAEFKKIFENFQDLYYQTDLNGVIKLVSPSIKTLTGYSQQDVIGRKSSEIYYNQKDRDIFMQEIKVKGEIRGFTTKLINSKGKPVDVSVTSHIIFDKNKKPIGIEGIIRDITSETKSEEILKLKLIELERLNKLMFGRELKMVELKEKINQLNANKR